MARETREHVSGVPGLTCRPERSSVSTGERDEKRRRRMVDIALREIYNNGTMELSVRDLAGLLLESPIGPTPCDPSPSPSPVQNGADLFFLSSFPSPHSLPPFLKHELSRGNLPLLLLFFSSRDAHAMSLESAADIILSQPVKSAILGKIELGGYDLSIR